MASLAPQSENMARLAFSKDVILFTTRYLITPFYNKPLPNSQAYFERKRDQSGSIRVWRAVARVPQIYIVPADLHNRDLCLSERTLDAGTWGAGASCR